jgi:hypothetical protein
VKCYTLDVLCVLAVGQGMPRASDWIDDLHDIAERCGMREFVVRAREHRFALGDHASGSAAKLLAREIANPALSAMLEGRR